MALARRALRNSLRRPQLLAPLLVFPSLLLAINVGGLERTTALPGFPDAGFLDFQLAAAITQSLLLGGVSAGIAAALDIESGFFDRLVAAPIPRAAIVLGRLVAVAVLSLFQALFFIALGLVFGAHIAGGAGGTLLVLATATLAGVGFGAIGQALALYARNASVVQGVFPIAFVILFLSSAFFPIGLLSPPADWVAEYNPLSYIADGMRAPVIEGIEWVPVLEGLLAAAALAGAMMLLSIAALRRRLGET